VIRCEVGDIFDLKEDPFEQSPRFVDADDPETRTQRETLQHVLDSMKPYPMFDPTTVPRRDPNKHFDGYRFQDDGGYVVIEAEDLPTPRDESWLAERHAPDYLGSGYLRSLRDCSLPMSTSPDDGRLLFVVEATIPVARRRMSFGCALSRVLGCSARSMTRR
jgi:hypothetical protein